MSFLTGQEQAHTSATAIREHTPDFVVEDLIPLFHVLKDTVAVERLKDHLRQAGLPK